MANGIGDRLRARAKELGLTDAEVARRLGLAQSRYAHYVSGTRSPDYQTLARICRVLVTTPDYVLGFHAESVEGRPEDALLRERAVSTINAMDQRTLGLAAELLDVIARRLERGGEPS